MYNLLLILIVLLVHCVLVSAVNIQYVYMLVNHISMYICRSM